MTFSKSNLEQCAMLQFEYSLAHEATNHHLFGMDECGIHLSDEAVCSLIKQGIFKFEDFTYETVSQISKKATVRYGGTNLFCFIWSDDMRGAYERYLEEGRI